MEQLQPQTEDLGALTIAAFCERFRISPASYYKQARLGLMPSTIKVGRHTLIPHVSIRSWLQKKIAEAA